MQYGGFMAPSLFVPSSFLSHDQPFGLLFTIGALVLYTSADFCLAFRDHAPVTGF